MSECKCGHPWVRHQDSSLAPECLDCECRQFRSADTQPAPASGEGEALREAIGCVLDAWPEHNRIDEHEAVLSALLAVEPLARLVTERDEAREKVRRVEVVLADWDRDAEDMWDQRQFAAEEIRAALGGEQEDA